MKRICFDLDGVICELRQPGQGYEDLQPMPGAVEKIKALRANGCYIILHTARHMKTCDGNVGKVIARLGKITLDWLAKHGVVYDEIIFGKPWADIYVDDNALRFTNWSSIADDGRNLPVSSEKTLSEA